MGRYRINKKLNLQTPEDTKVLTKDDIICIIKYLIQLINSKAEVDDIDHLSNRRVRTVGEQLYSQFGVGLARMARTIRERMNVRDNEVFTPTDLINAKTLSSVINSFLELTSFPSLWIRPIHWLKSHIREDYRHSGQAVYQEKEQDLKYVTFTIHYGRLCTIETPEGPNIGLISSLCVYAKINNLGFIETPYRKSYQWKVEC